MVGVNRYQPFYLAELREIYDRFGEEILKSGVPPEKTEDPLSIRRAPVKGGYRFSGNIPDIFEKFFGTSNPHTVTLDGNTYF